MICLRLVAIRFQVRSGRKPRAWAKIKRGHDVSLPKQVFGSLRTLDFAVQYAGHRFCVELTVDYKLLRLMRLFDKFRVGKNNGHFVRQSQSQLVAIQR